MIFYMVTMSSIRTGTEEEEESFLAFKHTISFKELLTLSKLEVFSAEVTINNLNIIICLIYKSPNCVEQYHTSLLLFMLNQ